MTDTNNTLMEDNIPREMLYGTIGVVVVLILTLVYLNFINAIIQSGKNEI